MSDDNLRKAIRDLTPDQQKAILVAVKEDQKYQGWTNHATWVVNLHLGNNEKWYKLMRESAANARRRAPRCSQVKQGIWTVAEAEVFNLADQVKAWVESLATSYGNSPTDLLRVDLMTGTLEDVDWNAIARTLLEE